MSTTFKQMSAEEFERDHYADELEAERKADKKSRVTVSNHAAAFNWLIDVGGVSANIHLPLYIYLDKTRGEEKFKFFSEKEAGALLPGEEGVTDGSRAKRWKRAWNEIESEQARTGKCFAGRREKGSIRLASRQSEEKKIAPSYYSNIAQAVVDVERLASRMRGKRDDRFRRAALEVWANLPAYVAPEEATNKVKATSEPRENRLAGRNTRRMTRFDNTVKEMIKAEKANGDDAAQKLTARLAVKLGKLAAEALGVESESVFRLMAEALEQAAENTDAESAEFDAPTQNEICDFAQENDVSQDFNVDSPVHVQRSEKVLPGPAIWRNSDCDMPVTVTSDLGHGSDGRRYVSIAESAVGIPFEEIEYFPDYQTWLSANDERVASWCNSDTERWQMYEAEKALAAEGRTVEDVISDIPPDEQPTAFRAMKQEKHLRDHITYAEDFIV